MKYSVGPIYVKPYVYYYYNKNDLNPLEKAALKNLLCNVNTRDEVKYQHCPAGYKELRVYIEERWFDSHIHSFSRTNAQRFAVFLEQNLKDYFEKAIELQIELCKYHGHKFEITDVLLQIRQEVLNLNEEEWPLESIIKHIQRFCKREKIDYSGLKKLRAPVRKNSANSAKLPRGYLWLKDWLSIAKISERTFRNCFRHEIPTLRVGNKLAVATIDVL